MSCCLKACKIYPSSSLNMPRLVNRPHGRGRGAAAAGAGFVVITGGGGSELLQACDEFRGGVSPTQRGGSACRATSGLACAEPGLPLEP